MWFVEKNYYIIDYIIDYIIKCMNTYINCPNIKINEILFAEIDKLKSINQIKT